MGNSVEGKICLVTGGGRGIGRAVTAALAMAGAEKVIICDIHDAAFAEISAEYDNVEGMVADVTRTEQVAALAQTIHEKYGRIDVLVNNAGITRDALIQKMEDDAWDAVIDINLKGVFLTTRAVAPIMLEQGSGSIINMASVVGIDGNIGQTNYAASKGGVISMTKTWAKEFPRKGARITCNAVAPGFIRTPMTEKVPEKVLDLMVGKTPLGRMGEAEDVAKAVLFLASDDASFITGQVIRVDGGLTF